MVTIEEIKKMQRLVEIFGKTEKPGEKKKTQIYKDAGIFKDLFPEEKNSVEIFHKLREEQLG
ncbi:MAG: hypothetical protein ACE5K4_09960 [Candidatus Hydrothermarchaeota archaeon]